MNQPYEHRTLTPLAKLLVERVIENTNRKLVAGFRNKVDTQANATSAATPDNRVLRDLSDALVSEIESLQAGASPLEGSQEDALVVLCELKQQLDELLALADGYAHCRQEVGRLASVQGQQETELTALQASIEAQNQKLVASTLARVQKEGAIRKGLEQHQQKLIAQQGQAEVLKQQLAASSLARESLSTTVTTALKKLALATSTQAQRVDSVEERLASLVERQREGEAQPQLGWATYLERNAVSLAALAVAVFSLGLNLLG